MKKQTVILAGGGHTHALLLKLLQEKRQHPLPCKLVLLSGSRYTPYSGMLPGVISGRYQPEEAHIDLAVLAQDSKCEFLEDSIVSLDADRQKLTTARGQTLHYDLLSINTGSTQSRVIDGPDCISIKPITPFLLWLSRDLPERIHQQERFNLVIIGAGAAGVEVALALKERFRHQPGLQLHIMTSGDVLPGNHPAVQNIVTAELNHKNIRLHNGFKVNSVNNHIITSHSGAELPYHHVVLATPAAPARWPSQSGLSTNHRGFIRVHSSLQSCSHSTVFASGDVAAFTEVHLAKCGVYAVRQAPILLQNIRHALNNQELTPYQPQQNFLSLLNCSDGRAIASKGAFRTKGSLVWLWKNWIDKRFMGQFPLPESGFMGLSIHR